MAKSTWATHPTKSTWATFYQKLHSTKTIKKNVKKNIK